MLSFTLKKETSKNVAGTTFKCKKPKRTSIINNTYTRDGVVHLVKSKQSRPEKFFIINTLVEMLPDFDFGDEK